LSDETAGDLDDLGVFGVSAVGHIEAEHVDARQHEFFEDLG
jgi:hypothetical protein